MTAYELGVRVAVSGAHQRQDRGVVVDRGVPLFRPALSTPPLPKGFRLASRRRSWGRERGGSVQKTAEPVIVMVSGSADITAEVVTA